MDYTTRTLIEAQLARTLTDQEATLLPKMQAAIKKSIDHVLLGEFDDIAAPTIRYYDGGTNIIDIDPCNAVTSVQLVDIYGNFVYTYFTPWQYQVKPINKTVKHWIEMKYDNFAVGKNNIAVTAIFTLGLLTDDIRYIAARMIADLFHEGNDGRLKSESIEGYARTFTDMGASDKAMQDVIAFYRDDEGVMF